MGTEECLLFTGLTRRLQNFVRILSAYHGVEVRISRLRRRGKSSPVMHRKRYFDHGMISLSAFTAFAATFIACLFWIGSAGKAATMRQ
ncbi:FUSC family protein [Tatumella ptyseos]|uniref:FUSC family protein n=1 Tax=Tatumella ptyseos TaxID=82987 RepID=UPI0030CE8361